MRKSRLRRMNPSSGYIGSGNKTNFFTNRPRTPFSRMKQIYGEELERFELLHSPHEANFDELLIQKKQEIRKKIKEEIVREKTRSILIVISVSAFVIILIILINYYLPRFL